MLRIFEKRLKLGKVTENVTVYDGYQGFPHWEASQCLGCGQCGRVCPTQAIKEMTGLEQSWDLDPKSCILCGRCYTSCPPGALAPSQTNTASRREGPAFPRSLHIRHLDSGSCNGCDFELNTLTNPVFDLQRLGMNFVASPRHADILAVTGAVSRNLLMAVEKTIAATPRPRLIAAVGTCACSGGIFQGSYGVLGGIDQVATADIYIPGCPPTPQAIIDGFKLAMTGSSKQK